MSESSTPSPRKLTRRSSSVVNRIETDRETIFFNSPDEKNADIVHEIVPEIKIAKQVFEKPGTVEKVRQVSQQIKTADEAIITRRRSLLVPVVDKKDQDIEVVNESARVATSTIPEQPEEPTQPEERFTNEPLRPPSPIKEQGEERIVPENQPTNAPLHVPEVLATEIPVMAERVVEITHEVPPSNPKPTAAELPAENKSATAINVSSMDTPTTILSRNVMFKESDSDDTSSDSSSSESEPPSPQNVGDSSATKWRWQDVLYCCCSRK